jgi:hypothetical protein
VTPVRWLLVHPPLLGPALLAPLAGVLLGRDEMVALPDLRAEVETAPGWPERYVRAAAATGPADVVVGFSGAGVVLPSIAVATGAQRVVWIDALMPARDGATVPDDDIRSRVAVLVKDGRIADWTTWWGPGVFDELVPDPQLRAAIRAESHELPADFYDVAVPVPDVWPEGGAQYVQLSPAYEDAAAEARERGWPVSGHRHGSHLDVANDPADALDLLGWVAGAGRPR